MIRMESSFSSSQIRASFPANRSCRKKDFGRKFPGFFNVKAASKLSKQRRPQNIEGEFYVDERCIDCDTCRWMAPVTQVFKRIDEQAAVYKQPLHGEERRKALQGVYYCGYHSEKSFGATSYLIVHPEGNIMVDSPRYTEHLAKRIEMLGGARYMFLTHRDDVADHAKWSRRLRCDRILHSLEVQIDTADVEMKLDGDGPWTVGPDFEIICTPGHTEGSSCLFYKPMKTLFTGDHIAARSDKSFSIFEMYNCDSVITQLDNVQKLLELDFLWILPGHGRRAEFKDTNEKNSALIHFLADKGHF
ncbi:uncharacterized protein LOC18437647 isoform X3 [Amborella trichopoda]|uniref:uncharacterized protein LOC18437647 isoform X3 n=1 Tax=Amborella trichopoda TaxID=13333 RepID=UPI0009BD5C72|nr:uncharacterized protein LOC18437647 isoform X3 [Amborella trichopoda]|eukprot:XP_020525197.1 uncharacterized protein LOC18437647 isoform X3 [Amborella trichopoda]